jgi:hypothetical protein
MRIRRTRLLGLAVAACALLAAAWALHDPRMRRLGRSPFSHSAHAFEPDSGAGDAAWAPPIGQLDTAVIPESSGIDKSARYDGIYWTHNDSGNPAELFAITLDGKIVARIPVLDAPNLDWEDIAVENGFVYVADIGNNFGWFAGRTIYKFAEPDPYSPAQVRPIASYHYGFPDKAFDAESLITRGEDLFIIRKAGPRASTLFKLTPNGHGGFVPTAVQEFDSTGITGADLSPDGRVLAVTSVWLLTCYPVNPDLTIRKDEKPRYVRYPFGGDVEACCFDGTDVVLSSESGAIRRVPAEVIETQKPFERAKKR